MANLVRRLKQVVTRYPIQYGNRYLATTVNRSGIEEFFPPGVYEGQNYTEEEPVVGRRWKLAELRIRSNSDLHKFWYVLLKERNMLMTLDHECKRLGTIVPGPTRLHKVEKTMEMVEFVVKEREQAIMDLEKERRYKFDGQNTATQEENSENTSTMKTTQEQEDTVDMRRSESVNSA